MVRRPDRSFCRALVGRLVLVRADPPGPARARDGRCLGRCPLHGRGRHRRRRRTSTSTARARRACACHVAEHRRPAPGVESDEQVADRSRPGARRATPPPPAPEPSGSGAPEGEAEDVDRSRPGARRPVAVPPVDVVTPAAVAPAAAPRPPVAPAAPPAAWVDGSAPPASPGHGFGGGAPAPAAFGAAVPGLASAPAGFGPADYGPGHGGGTYKAPRSWKIPVAVGIVSVLLLGAAAVVGIPRYQASQARDTAAQAPDVLVHAAPRTLAGQKKLVIPGLAGMAQALTADGAEWAWAQAYGTRDSFTLYLASDVPLSDRADAVKALTNHDAATHLLQQVSAGITSGSQAQAVPGTPAEYASPVGGKTWCMPITLSGVGGGYCLWTSGKEWLQVLSMPGLEQVAAKSTLTSLTQMAASVTQARRDQQPGAEGVDVGEGRGQVARPGRSRRAHRDAASGAQPRGPRPNVGTRGRREHAMPADEAAARPRGQGRRRRARPTGRGRPVRRGRPPRAHRAVPAGPGERGRRHRPVRRGRAGPVGVALPPIHVRLRRHRGRRNAPALRAPAGRRRRPRRTCAR